MGENVENVNDGIVNYYIIDRATVEISHLSS